MTHLPFSVGQAVNFAWPTFKKHFGLFASILLTTFGAWVTLEIIVIAGQRFGIVWWVLAHLAFLIFFAGVEVGFLHTGLVLYDGGEPTFIDTFRYLALGPKFLAGQVTYVLMIVVGLPLFVVPGLYLGVRYAFFGFCLVNGKAELIHSFQQSAILSSGAKSSLLGILVSLLVLNVLGASLLGLGLFVTIPLTVLMMTAVYQQLSLQVGQTVGSVSSSTSIVE